MRWRIMIEKSLLNELFEKYGDNGDIWSDEQQITRALRYIVFNKLNDVDRIIFLLYVDLASLRQVGKALGLSHSVIYKEIKRIKEVINGYMYNNPDGGGDSGICD